MRHETQSVTGSNPYVFIPMSDKMYYVNLSRICNDFKQFGTNEVSQVRPKSVSNKLSHKGVST